MPAGQALTDALALRAGDGFEPVAAQVRRYVFAGTVDVPVTIGWGTRDRILPPDQAQRARRRLPTAHHVPLPRAGHVPMFDEPAMVAELILRTTARAGAGPEPGSADGPDIAVQR
jgi:pimeloyl-ACP methyl ester carboxylesterase